MSHVAAVDLKIQDLDALEAVCGRMGLELVRGKTTYKWFGRFLNDWTSAEGQERAAALNGFDPATFGHSLHVVRRKDRNGGAYEIGIVARRDGKPGFEAVYDAWGSGGKLVEQIAGKNLVTLKKELSTEVSLRHLQRQGYRVSIVETQKAGQ